MNLGDLEPTARVILIDVLLAGTSTLETFTLEVLLIDAYLVSPEYFTSTVWLPAVNSGTCTLALPLVTVALETSLPSTKTYTVPVASLGKSTSTTELSPGTMSGIVILMSGFAGVLIVKSDEVTFVLNLESPI